MDNFSVKKRLLSDFFTYYPMGGALYDKDGSLIEINKALSEKFIVTDKTDFLLHNLFETELLSDLQKDHLRHGSTVSDKVPLGFSIIPSQDEDGCLFGYIFLLTDVPSHIDMARYDPRMQELEDMTQKVVESVPDTILLINNELFVERVIAYATETCITPDAINRRIDDLPGFIYPDETKKKVVAIVGTCLESSQIVNLELSIPGHTTPIVYFKIRMVPVHHKYVVLYIRNVSEQVEQEKENKTLSEQLSKSRTMMELALQNSKISTYSFSFDRFHACDKQHCNRCFQFYGATNEMLGKNKYICKALAVLRNPEDEHDFFFLFNEIRNLKLDEHRVTFRLKNNEGVYRSYEVIGKTQALDADGFPNLIVGCMIDNQERIEYEASLIQAKEKAEKADLLKSTFLANMTHEIRTPLNAIVGFSDLLGVETDPELRETYIDLIKSNNELLLCLINDVLDISKIESGMMTFSYMNVHLLSLMKELYNMILLRMPDGVDLVLDPCQDILFCIDRNRLSQILINLLTNATKNTSQGSIRFGYELQQKELLFYVTDTGCGIPEKDLQHIFGRFVQLNGYKQGIGIGLAICKGLVAKMGGKITVSSAYGKGSTFSFTLPVERPAELNPGPKE